MKSIHKFSRRVGAVPGTLVHIGEKRADQVRIQIMDYDEKDALQLDPKTVEECFAFRDTKTVTWINVDGLHDVGVIEAIGKRFDIHPLTLEDILHTEQRPKVEMFPNYAYVVLKMMRIDEEDNLQVEQVSFVIMKGCVISFQEQQGDVFDYVRQRIMEAKGRIRTMGSDFLAYALIDAIVDHYFVILENFSDETESLEEDLLEQAHTNLLAEIQDMKRQMIFLRKSIWPLREVLSQLQKYETVIFSEAVDPYLRDVYDHTIQVVDMVEGLRDTISGLMDIYLSSASNKMNEIMKVLTVFSTIFIPLTFIAGVYGMNFEHMPELHWRWGYFLVLGFMAMVVAGMLAFFRAKRWF
ncbi:MAG TPA: magnesium/cobalt transporter CorA [Candidatus Omnitrophota bacterium]|nr:magnesium/cobalt transporter CorA [Candidatus Omnitrophota bacterium]